MNCIIVRLLEVADESTLNYEGKEININNNTLNEAGILGFGHFGNVMLAKVEVNQDTIIKMAVKVNLIDLFNKNIKFSLIILAIKSSSKYK